MSPRTSKVPVDDDNSHKNGEGVHDEREEQILGNKWEHQGCRRKDLGHEQQEHNQWQEDGNTQGDFLSCLRR